MAEVSSLASKPFPFLRLPFEIRQQIYNEALSTTISITDSRLSRSPTLEEVSFLASRRGAWNLCLCSRLVYAESTRLLWDNLTIALAKDGTSQEGEDGRHRLGNADQAFRRKIRRIVVSDPACYGLCYGMQHCFHLQALTVRVDKLDGIFLEKSLMSSKPTGAVHKPRGRRLRLEIQQVGPPPRSTAAGMMINSGKNGLGQIEWRRKWATRGERFRFMFLSDLIPNLPQGCRITLQVRVLEVTMQVLREFEGFTIKSIGTDSWIMSYDEFI
jgi:hypothetical protein